MRAAFAQRPLVRLSKLHVVKCPFLLDLTCPWFAVAIAVIPLLLDICLAMHAEIGRGTRRRETITLSFITRLFERPADVVVLTTLALTLDEDEDLRGTPARLRLPLRRPWLVCSQNCDPVPHLDCYPQVVVKAKVSRHVPSGSNSTIFPRCATFAKSDGLVCGLTVVVAHFSSGLCRETDRGDKSCSGSEDAVCPHRSILFVTDTVSSLSRAAAYGCAID